MAEQDDRPERERLTEANLRRAFQQPIEQGIPRQFQELLAALKAADRDDRAGGHSRA